MSVQQKSSYRVCRLKDNTWAPTSAGEVTCENITYNCLAKSLYNLRCVLIIKILQYHQRISTTILLFFPNNQQCNNRSITQYNNTLYYCITVKLFIIKYFPLVTNLRAHAPLHTLQFYCQ